jgi:outer membrane receptor for ferrienterochelin and colicins
VKGEIMSKISTPIILALFIITSLSTVIYASSENGDDLEKIYEMSIEDLMNISIVSASLREETLSGAAAPMYIVTAREIKERGYTTLKDAMEDVPGYIDLSDTNENIAGVRGAYASTTNKILIMINGHRMNSLSLGRYNTDQYIGMDAVERIEFVMGPGSVLYGTGAVIGVVNITQQVR